VLSDAGREAHRGTLKGQKLKLALIDLGPVLSGRLRLQGRIEEVQSAPAGVEAQA